MSQTSSNRRAFARALLPGVAIYLVASLLHFAHNAQYIVFYPNMPLWITPHTVWVVWAAITAVGVVGIMLALIGLTGIGALVIGAYGAFGLDGLGHYALALCSQHTLAMNATIFFESISGSLLMLAAWRFAWQRRIAVAHATRG